MGRRATDAATVQQKVHEQNFRHQLTLLRLEAAVQFDTVGYTKPVKGISPYTDSEYLWQIYHWLCDPRQEGLEGVAEAVRLVRERFHGDA